ncbi:MAG: bifunctional (p)ppGpp synthetase/guanosine-3',5'-bis(diphosphate) 3'-pyrophosphohydrolase [Spirochaetia bacterium]|nr:bifunctional (p)ppGpp synthetase/guanosine-3',5'-bis(diphosphate) 3'-pyrophosphohydrolase [Spirochaetia bacterium]
MLFKTQRKDIATLLKASQKQTNRHKRSLIKKAFFLATDAHKFQKRLSGEPYIVHPYNVSLTLAELEMDHETICAGLLHDVLEDTKISREFLEKEFGQNITRLVDGVTKISVLKTESIEKKQAENIRKMILATVQDARVIVIKLADKLHNMRTISFQPPEKAKRIAKETLDIYAPLAGRLGMFKIKSELEDLALYVLESDIYQQIKQMLSQKKKERADTVNHMVSALKEKLKESKIKADIAGRSKHFYSIYQKMKDKNKAFEEIYDLTGIRIIVENIQHCYGALGIVHTIWNPVPGRFKDYISMPKSNGYQSLHTSVITPDGKVIEVQIRSRQMHQIAEIGIAAHWTYKEKKDDKVLIERFNLLQQIASLEEQGENAGEFIEELKENLGGDEIYVFTPKGEIIAMPKDSTVLDFAFRIHTDIGLKCAGARINNRLVSIRTLLKSGDQLTIQTNSSVKPSLGWIKFLKTTQARNKLRAYLRKNEITPENKLYPNEIIDGQNLTEILKAKNKNKEKTKTEKSGGAKNKEEKTKPAIEWQGETNIETRYAKCCAPLPGDKIMGFITRGAGITIHKNTCNSLISLMQNDSTKDRIINLRWSGMYEPFPVHIAVNGNDRSHIFFELVKVLTDSGANIIDACASTASNGKIYDSFTIEVDSNEHLETILSEIRKVKDITYAERIKSLRKTAG